MVNRKKSNILKFFLKDFTYDEYVSLYSHNIDIGPEFKNDATEKTEINNDEFVQLAFDV